MTGCVGVACCVCEAWCAHVASLARDVVCARRVARAWWVYVMVALCACGVLGAWRAVRVVCYVRVVCGVCVACSVVGASCARGVLCAWCGVRSVL